MPALQNVRLRGLLLIGVVGSVLLGFKPPATSAESGRSTLHIEVKDAETGKPINQARLTLIFREPRSKFRMKRSQNISYSAKTNALGHYRFTAIPEGTVRLMVTSEGHESFGKDFEIEKDSQVIEVKLKKPQPLL